MRFLEYMGFVLAVFPLKYGFIIVEIYVTGFAKRDDFPKLSLAAIQVPLG